MKTIRTWPVPQSGVDNNNWGPATENILTEVAGLINPSGMVGDGVADDTEALQSAIAANTTIYLKAGTYKITSPITLANNVIIVGAGRGATVLAVSGNITLFSVATPGFELRNLTIQNTGKTGIGININQSATTRLCLISGCRFTGLATGIYFQTPSPTFDEYVGSVIDNCEFYANNTGVNILARAEFVRISKCDMFNNDIGVIVIGGNSRINDCNISRNGYGVQVLNGENDSHGTITNTLLVHNTTRNLYVYNNTWGHIIHGCCFAGGSVYLRNARGVQIAHCYLGSGEDIYIEGGDWNLITENTLETTGCTIVRDYNSAADFSEVKNNRLITSHDDRA